MTSLLGLRLSPGLALGPAHIVPTQTEPKLYEEGTATDEFKKFQRALLEVDQDLARIEETSRKEQADIIAAHRLLLQDPEWHDQIQDRIQNQNYNAPEAVKITTREFAQMMAGLDDPYLRERAHDIEDVGNRVLQNIYGEKNSELLPTSGNYILVAKDLSPSQFASLDKTRLLGLVTEQGGVTSHTAIMARLYEIPALSGIENATARIQNGDILFLHADKSDLHLKPNASEQKEFSTQVANYQSQKKDLLLLKEQPSITLDGTLVQLEANIGRESDLDLVQKYNAEGVGLFRTEFLFFDRTQAPSEEEQTAIYQKVVQTLAPHPVVIRTFDIGADKQVPYLKWPKEDNPFLGLRALRYCLKEPKLFHTQLRALLKASHVGPLSIMFPMVSSIEELKEAKTHLALCEKEVRASGLNPQYKLGIMIEVPAAALISEHLAAEVDFFSIGTNDLIQYVCAVDRMNEAVAHLYESFHPGVLHLIEQVILAGRKHKVEVAMCGEMAADLDLIPLLLGMGLRIFSQSPATVLRSKHLIRSLQLQDCEQLWQEAKKTGSSIAIQKICRDFSAAK